MFSQDVWRCLPCVQLTGLAGDISLLSPRARPRLSSSHHTSWVTKHWSYNRKEDSQYKETVTKTVMSVLASEADSQTIIVVNYFMK